MSVEHWFIPWFRWLFMLVISVLTNKKNIYIWSGARSELKKSEKSASVQWRTLKSWGTVVQGHFKNDKKIWLLRKNIKRWGLFWWLHIFFHYYFFILATSMTFCVLMLSQHQRPFHLFKSSLFLSQLGPEASTQA